MKTGELITLMAIFQTVNLYMLLSSKNRKIFLKKKSGQFFLVLPLFVILSLFWRPL